MKILLFANTDWYIYNFRRSLALALRETGHEVLLLSPPGPYGKRLQAHGLRWVPAPMQRLSLNPLRELRLLIWLMRLIRRENIDLVHGYTIKCAVYGALAARLAGNRPRVSAVAGMGYVFTSQSMKARLLRPVVRWILRAALGGWSSRLILQNADDVAVFEQARLIDASQIRLIKGSGVDLARFVPRREVLPPPFRVVLPARLLWDKGVGELVEASRQLKTRGVEVAVLLAGEPDAGNPAAVPEDEIHRWQAAGLVEWLGKVDDMPGLFASVHAVALPSYYGEGLPKSLIEAASCERPLITTDMPGCREVVTDGVDGLLVPVRDAAALADAIQRLAGDPVLCRRLGETARRKAEAEFDERIVIKRTMAVYQELLPARIESV